MHSAVAGGDTVAVCTALDAGYLPLVLVVATSIAASAAPTSRVVFHVLYDGPDSWVVRRIERWRHPQVEIVLHQLPNPFTEIGIISGFPSATLFRFAVPRILADLDRVIYLDVDLVVETDLRALHDVDLGGNPLGAAVDLHTVDSALTIHSDRQAARADAYAYLHDTLGFRSPAEMLGYVQAGVMVLDLQRLREMDYEQRMTGMVQQLKHAVRFADQCLTNMAFRGQITLVDPRWNVRPEGLADDLWGEVIPELAPAIVNQRREPWIIHFANRKPWQRWGLPGSDRWWRHARRAGLGPYYAGRFIAHRVRTELHALRNRLGRAR
jgi:lipopolysaccharide biosynthesis glycosyltransferase